MGERGIEARRRAASVSACVGLQVANVDHESEVGGVHGCDDSGEFLFLPGRVGRIADDADLEARGIRAAPRNAKEDKGGRAPPMAHGSLERVVRRKHGMRLSWIRFPLWRIHL